MKSSDIKCDAIIVLANQMDSAGNLNQETRARVDTAAQALKSNIAPLMVTCGWAYRKELNISLAESMQLYASTNHGIAPSSVLTEMTSKDTVGDAVFTKRKFAILRQWTRLLIVTSDYHLARARDIFSFIYGPSFKIDMLGAPSANTPELKASEENSLLVFKKTFAGINAGDDDAILKRLQSSHPYYNGEIYDYDG